MAKLAAGYNIIIKQKVGSSNTPLYPFTAVENVFDKDGNSLDTLLSGITGQNFVPDYSEETTSNLRFLRNDNTWATIQDATISQKGVVQLTNAFAVAEGETASQTLATTQKALVDAKAAIDSAIALKLDASAVGVSVASLADGKVPAAQLPSYVDDVIEGYLYEGSFYEDSAHTQAITPESGKIYVDLTSMKTYRWGGSAYAEISESIAIGTTAGTAYDGAAGAALATKLATITEGANKVEASTTNGNIKIDGVETTVYTLDAASIKTTLGAASADNDGYMTSSQATKLAGISAEANKVEASETNGNIKIDGTETTVYTLTKNAIDTTQGASSSSNNGYMTSTQYDKLENCVETAVSPTADAPTFTNGLWFEEVSAYTPNPDDSQTEP